MRKSSYLCTRKKAKASTSPLNGAIAQLVEHRTENPCVTGSNPVGTTLRKKQLRHHVTASFFYLRTRCERFANDNNLHNTTYRSLDLWQVFLY